MKKMNKVMAKNSVIACTKKIPMEELEKICGGDYDTKGRRVKFYHGTPYYL
jgi:hypothetical protein